MESTWWKNISAEFKSFVKNKCQMCGECDPNNGLRTHHMSYNHLGRKAEWEDVVVICADCHSKYHEVHKLPPMGKFTRLEMLNHLAETLADKGVDTFHFIKHGSTDCRIWNLFTPSIVAEIDKKARIARKQRIENMKVHSPPEPKKLEKGKKFKPNKIDDREDWYCRLRLDVERYPKVIKNLLEGKEIRKKLLAEMFGINIKKPPQNWFEHVMDYVKKNKSEIRAELNQYRLNNLKRKIK